MPNPFDRLNTALADRYRVERELGRGGMATVYLAQDLKHERRVAIKVLKPELAGVLGPERFLREIKVTAQLNHPHILPLLDSGDADGLLYYVMPFAEGESLQDRLNREKQLPVEDALRIAREVADALDYAHRHDVVHRDIKPANILLLGRHAVVADFGIARAITIAGGDRVTETGLALGTPAYMSPEQGSAEPSVDHRTDVYSLACVLYEMLAGTPPFAGPSVQAVLARHALDPVPPLRTVRALVPETVEAAILRALAKSPADRTGTVEEFARALITEHPAVAPYAGPPKKAPGAIACPACGAESPNTARYCRQCGAWLFRRCPECGADNRASHRYCEGCGTELPEGGLHPGADTARATAHLPAGERRQLTVMSCNLTASTTLSGELDPEDLRELVLRHQEDCFELIRRYEGYLAGQLGSAFLVYFGYPAAHEDDPWRAVSAGLEIVGRAADWATGIDARVAVHTGLVVVGETDARRAALQVMGTTPDLAVRLQDLVPPQSVMVSVDTRRLVEGLFAWETVGPRTFPGLSQPVEIGAAPSGTPQDAGFRRLPPAQPRSSLHSLARLGGVPRKRRPWDSPRHDRDRGRWGCALLAEQIDARRRGRSASHQRRLPGLGGGQQPDPEGLCGRSRSDRGCKRTDRRSREPGARAHPWRRRALGSPNRCTGTTEDDRGRWASNASLAPVALLAA